MTVRRGLALVAGVALAALVACARPAAPGPELAPTRGVVLIVLGSVGAGHLGAYGADGATSPFFDRLAARGALFERAFSQSPNGLISNSSLFTGLYPAQHGVRPPARALSPDLATLPERFSNFGYRTAGFTEDGFVGRHFGFHRGFDHFNDPPATRDSDVERTFAAGIDFLRGPAADDRFFLFLHTSSAAAPYAPPRGSSAAPAAAAGGAAPTLGPTELRALDRGFATVDAATAARLAAAYDDGITYLDAVLESFFTELDRLGLTAATTVVVTADHGQEFLEHGGLGSFQVYPQTVHVPLVVLHPGVAPGRRVGELVELVDLAPTLYELQGLPPAAASGGRSLLPQLAGEERAESFAYAEAATIRRQRTLLRRRDGVTHQLVATTVAGERDGTWITRRAGLELEPGVALSAVSFHRARRLRLWLDGEPVDERTLGTDWASLPLAPPPGRPRYRLDLEADGCDSPRALGISDDPRCLSLKLRGAEVRLLELFALDPDPGASRDRSDEHLELRRELADLLANLEWSLVAPPASRPATGDAVAALRALGYGE